MRVDEVAEHTPTSEVVRAALAPVFEKYAGRIVAAYLFGSSAEGTVGPMSDIDLAVLLEPNAVLSAAEIKIDLYVDCSRALKRNDIDVVVLNTAKNMFLLNDVVRKGVVLFDRDTGYRHEFEVKVLHDFIDFKQRRQKVMED